MFSKFGYWKFAIGTLLLPVCLGFETAYGKDGVQNQLAGQIQLDTSVTNFQNLQATADSLIKNQEADTETLKHANYYAHHCNCNSSHRHHHNARRHHYRQNYYPQRYHHYQNINYQYPRRHHSHCRDERYYSSVNYDRHNDSKYLHRYQHFGRHQYRHGYYNY
jgi:hypothetical protein